MLSGAVPVSSGRPLAGRGPFRCSKHVGNPAGEVERVLRYGIMNAVEDLSAAAERLAEADGNPWSARVRFGHEERLGEEALELARALRSEPCLRREPARPGDCGGRDHERLPDPRGGCRVLLAKGTRLQQPGPRDDRVNRAVDAEPPQLACQANS